MTDQKGAIHLHITLLISLGLNWELHQIVLLNIFNGMNIPFHRGKKKPTKNKRKNTDF